MRWDRGVSQQKQALGIVYRNTVMGLLPLGLPTLAKAVRASDGRAQVTDGPYLDAGRAVGGYFVFEADDLNAALRLASRSPAARLGSAVEVRPVAK